MQPDVNSPSRGESSDEPRLAGPHSRHIPPEMFSVGAGHEPATTATSSGHMLPALVRLLGVVCFLLVLQYVVPSTVEQIQYSLTRGRQRAEYETAGQTLSSLPLHALSAAYQSVSQRVGPSVVHIQTRVKIADADARSVKKQSPDPLDHRQPPSDGPMIGDRVEQGSGVVVDAQGFIVTNYHVVAQAESISVTLSDGRRVPADVVGHDWMTDVAVLRIKADDLIAAEWGDSESLQEGALVWAIGMPYGLKRSISAGIVSAKSLAGVAGRAYQDYLQTDAAVNPGSSGGPLVDVEGRVVGINTAILGESYRGISFAVPSNIVQNIYERLRSSGHVERGWLGVVLEDVTAERARLVGLSMPMGALVREVGINGENGKSPAAAAGLEAGDIVMRWGDKTIDRHETLMREVAQTETGSSVEVEVLRDGERLRFPVTVGTRPRQYG